MGLFGVGAQADPKSFPFPASRADPNRTLGIPPMDIPFWEGHGLRCGVRLQKTPQAATKFGGDFLGFFFALEVLLLVGALPGH